MSIVKLVLTAQPDGGDTSYVAVKINTELILKRVQYGDDLMRSMYVAVEQAMIESMYGPVEWVSDPWGGP